MKHILSMLLFILVLGTILTSSLLTVEYLTAPTIAENERRTVQASVLAALKIPYDESSIEETFDQRVEVRESDGVRFYVAQDGAVAVSYEGSGLWGPISGTIAINPDGRTLRAVTIIHQEETPGLGGRIVEEEYLGTFKGKDFRSGLTVTAPGRAIADNQIDGISGATMTSNAFIRILNERLSEILAIYEEMTA